MHGLGQPSDVLSGLCDEQLEPPAIVTFEEWTRCSPWLEAALEYGHGTHDIWDVLAAVEANQATFWPWERSALVTQIERCPKLTVCTFWIAGGDMAELMSKEPGVSAWAKRNGCNRIAIHGRRGWARMFESSGYQSGFHTVIKEV